jgi:hypothetical protein
MRVSLWGIAMLYYFKRPLIVASAKHSWIEVLETTTCMRKVTECLQRFHLIYSTGTNSDTATNRTSNIRLQRNHQMNASAFP